MKEELKDIFDTQCWLYKVINDPYQVFAEAFSTAGLDSYRRFIKKILHYAEANEMYSEEPPCDVLLLMKIIRSLIKASDSLKEIKKGPVVVHEGDAFNKKYYRSHYVSSNEWEEFPRFLSVKEFCNPYKVFRKFFRYQPCGEWIHDLEETVDCALSNNNGELGLEMIAIYTHLVKLTEAAHLINVREITHIGGILKNRFVNN
ncbi:MAG: hypothetical protein ACTHOB_17305 [Ginsengibacter sp.]